MGANLDSIDRKILERLQVGASLSGDALAEAVGASRSAVQRRIARLKADRVIEKEIAVIAPEAVGRPMSFIIGVALERESQAVYQSFKRRVAAIPEVQQCFYVTGDSDFILILTARDMGDYDRIVHDLFVDDPQIRRFHTSVVIQSVKVGLSVAVD